VEEERGRGEIIREGAFAESAGDFDHVVINERRIPMKKKERCGK